MNARSLHVRLAAWHAVWLGLVFAVSGVLVYYGLRHYLENHAALLQRQRAERIGALVLRTAPGRALAEEITTRFAPEASGRFVRVVAADGSVVYQSGPPHDQSFDPARVPGPPLRPATIRESLPGGIDFLRVSVPAGPPERPGYWIESGESMAPALVELHRLLVSLGAVFLVVAAVAVGGGILLVRRALAIVEGIAGSAERITSRNLSERLPVPETGDEFEHLSRTLNRMIDRLDEAFAHNRRFLADASHELRTPLTILRGELENLAQESRIGPEFRERLGSTLEETERLAGIVQGLFDLARLDAGEGNGRRAPVDLARLAGSTADQMMLLADDKGVGLECRIPGPVWVDGNRSRLKQVVVNLLDNAIKYTPRDGKISLRVRVEGERAVLEVVDDGIGIAPAELPHVFDRFYRVDKARSRDQGGAGLGLSIVKSICTAHGGTVEARSGGHDGTTFRVELPACPAPVQLPPPEE